LINEYNYDVETHRQRGRYILLLVLGYNVHNEDRNMSCLKNVCHFTGVKIF